MAVMATSARFSALADATSNLMAAFGSLIGVLPPTDPIYKSTDAVLKDAENALCREDPAGYVAWVAEQIKYDRDKTWEPCDAWWETDLSDTTEWPF
jgi:hypothetical protein